MFSVMKAVLWGACMVAGTGALAAESTCYGTISRGRLQGGVQLPVAGPNFASYSRLAVSLGRTYVHSKVRDIVLEAYQRLERETPGKVFVYGETGLRNGGPFPPHRTHQNGLSVDFMVPVIDERGVSVPLPTHALNKFGYAVEFDDAGRYEHYMIDFHAMAAHIVSLDRVARAHGASVSRVIFAPELQPHLVKTAYGQYLRKHVRFSRTRVWVRHDEHYHVDFQVPCRQGH